MRLLRQQLGVLALVALSGQLGTIAFSAIALGCRIARVEAAEVDECCPTGSHPGKHLGSRATG
jgi:predicted membrane metal-binding protein